MINIYKVISNKKEFFDSSVIEIGGLSFFK